MGPAIEFLQVRKTYPGRLEPALADVSFEVAPGEVCGFLGPNGAGKTTCIHILMGFVFADGGAVRVLGLPPGALWAKRQIGFVPENFAFHPFLTAPKLLRFHAALAALDEATAAQRIPELIARVELSRYQEVHIARYSRGMVQRLGIAQALLADPQLLVLDEPTSGLDPAGRRDVRELLLGLKAQGKTVFLSSHNLTELEQVCDRVIIIDRGRLVREGRLDEMLARQNQVEFLVDQLPEDAARALAGEGAVVEPQSQGVRIVADQARKREIAERLWTAGCDVISMQPVKTSLEHVFLKLVDESEKSR